MSDGELQKSELSIVIVEDSDDDRELLVRELGRVGYTPAWRQVQTAAEMADALDSACWDLIVADYNLPDFDAPAALRVLQSTGLDIPFIIVSGTVGEEAAVAALKAGANDFIMKGRFSRLGPAIQRELREAEERRMRRRAEASWRESESRFATAFERSPNAMALIDSAGRYLEVNEAFTTMTGVSRDGTVGQTARELGFWAEDDNHRRISQTFRDDGHVAGQEARVRGRDGELRTGLVSIEAVHLNAERCSLMSFLDISERKASEVALARSHDELREAYDTTLSGWARALELRDAETHGHSARVTDMTVRMAVLAGMSDGDLVNVRRGALLHDIGKMGVPDNVLLKTGPLDADEWALMRKHPEHAYEMLSPIAFLRPALEIPLYHHERWDGGGYPRGLSGEAIPLAARLFAVVDVWDALSSVRPYKEAWPLDRILPHLAASAGSHFDPLALELFTRALNATISEAA